MNTVILAFFVATVAIAMADYHGYDDGYDHGYYGYQQGLRKVPGGYAAPYNNAARQAGVNYIAEKVGASSGTSRYYGVPGSGRSFGYSAYYGYGGSPRYHNRGGYHEGY